MYRLCGGRRGRSYPTVTNVCRYWMELLESSVMATGTWPRPKTNYWLRVCNKNCFVTPQLCCIICNTTSNYQLDKATGWRSVQNSYRHIVCAFVLLWYESVIHYTQWRYTMDSPPSSVKIKNDRNYTSALPVCLHGTERENFTFTFYSVHWRILNRLKVFQNSVPSRILGPQEEELRRRRRKLPHEDIHSL
jgi:hypothetical protein